jgi:hypothetical protein
MATVVPGRLRSGPPSVLLHLPGARDADPGARISAPESWSTVSAEQTLDGIELVHLRLPLVAPWVTSLGVIDQRDVLLVRVVAGGVSGWGDCVAQPEPTYSAEYVDGTGQGPPDGEDGARGRRP